MNNTQEWGGQHCPPNLGERNRKGATVLAQTHRGTQGTPQKPCHVGYAGEKLQDMRPLSMTGL